MAVLVLLLPVLALWTWAIVAGVPPQHWPLVAGSCALVYAWDRRHTPGFRWPSRVLGCMGVVACGWALPHLPNRWWALVVPLILSAVHPLQRRSPLGKDAAIGLAWALTLWACGGARVNLVAFGLWIWAGAGLCDLKDLPSEQWPALLAWVRALGLVLLWVPPVPGWGYVAGASVLVGTAFPRLLARPWWGMMAVDATLGAVGLLCYLQS